MDKRRNLCYHYADARFFLIFFAHFEIIGLRWMWRKAAIMMKMNFWKKKRQGRKKRMVKSGIGTVNNSSINSNYTVKFGNWIFFFFLARCMRYHPTVCLSWSKCKSFFNFLKVLISKFYSTFLFFYLFFLSERLFPFIFPFLFKKKKLLTFSHIFHKII